MPRRSEKENKVRTIPNAKRKLITMVICICIMLFSVLQVYYLARYTFGLEVSKCNMSVYNWVLKLISYDETNNQSEETL